MEDFIASALPGINRETVRLLDEKLTEVGVISLEDLKYVEGDYIKDILRPVQVKKFLDQCRSFQVVPTIQSLPDFTPTDFTPNPKEASVTNVTNLDELKIQKNWAESFNVPFHAFPKEIEEARKRGEKPSKQHTNEMIRIVVTAVMNIDETPGRKNLRIVAEKIIGKFPGMFEDRFGKSVICGGSSTLMKKFENCIDNKKRLRSGVEEFYEGKPKKRKNLRESYGCVQWQPSDVPEGESKEELLKYQKWLQEEYIKADKNEKKIDELMTVTYSVQRYFINNVKSSIVSVREEWPVLTQSCYLLKHSNTLLDLDIQNIFFEDYTVKGKKIYNFMKSNVKSPCVAKCINSIEQSKQLLENLTPEYIGALPLLMAYFKEEESLLFKELLVPDDVKTESLLTPYIVTFGCNLYFANEYAIVIDGEITTYCNDFLTALAVLFCSFYVFNIEYNADTALTMEFIQRCVANINPKRGTKVSSKEKTKHASITKKVIKLATAINDFEKIFHV